MKQLTSLTLLLACCFFAIPNNNLFAQLSNLSDEFDDANTIANWTQHNTGPLSTNYYETLEIDGSLIEGAAVAGSSGHLTLIPGPQHCGWYANIMGPMLSKTVTGNFVVSTYVSASNKNNVSLPPSSDYNAAGLIARNPNTEGNENYVIANIGFQSYSNGVGTETKTTINGASTLYLDPDDDAGEIRICRIGNTFRTYKMTSADSEPQLLLEIERPDLPSTLQVGLMANGWDASYDNPPNLRAEYDYIRYGEAVDVCDCTAPLPCLPPSISITGETDICLGDQTVLTATAISTDDCNTNYTWSPPIGLSDATIANPTASPTATTTYNVIATSGNGCSSMETVTIVVNNCTPSSQLHIQAFLEGAYTGSNLMHTQLSDDNLLPLNQVFNQAPWNYNGTENLNTNPANVVDWVLVELRAANDINSIVFQKSALLLANGSVVDATWEMDNSLTGIILDANLPSDDYYVLLRHQNHLAIISEIAHPVPNTTPIDFTTPTTVLSGTSQLANLGDGNYGLICGDMDHDGIISVADFNRYVTQLSLLNQYLQSDLNLDGNITVSDYNLYLPNASAIGVSVVRY